MNDDFEKYETLKLGGVSPAEAYSRTQEDGHDWTFGIRMLRVVYGLRIEEAQQVFVNHSV